MQELKHQDNEPVESYIKKFAMLWESLCKALQPQGAPLDMMKKDRFLAGLQDGLRWRVELKKPRSFKDVLEVAKNKEWKLKRMNQLGVETLQRRVEVRPVNPMQGHVPKDVQHATMVLVSPLVMPTIVAATIFDDGLGKGMREAVDLMKNLSLNLLSNGSANWGQKNLFSQATCDHT